MINIIKRKIATLNVTLKSNKLILDSGLAGMI